MTERFLTPARAKFESGGALFFAGFGLWVWIFSAMYPATGPIAWMNLSHDGQLLVGKWFAFAALIHGLGVQINGSRWWSPILRVIGMFGHSVGLAWMVTNTPNPVSTAVYVYAVFAGVMVLGMMNAVEDCALAARGKAWTL